MEYIIVNSKGKPLSQFTPNDLFGRSQLAFRKSDHYFFPSIQEAEDCLNWIQGCAIGKSKFAALKLRVEVRRPFLQS